MFYPGEAPEVWNGLYGGAIVRKGPLKAITSDGKTHSMLSACCGYQYCECSGEMKRNA